MSNTTQVKSFTVVAKQQLIAKGWSITALARRLKFARNTVSRTINHPTINPNVRAKIAEKLEIKL